MTGTVLALRPRWVIRDAAELAGLDLLHVLPGRPQATRPRRRLVAVLGGLAVLAAAIAAIGIVQASSDPPRAIYPQTDSLPCPLDITNYQPATNAPEATIRLVPTGAKTVAICAYQSGALAYADQPYSTQDPQRTPVAAIALELNRSPRTACQVAPGPATTLIRFGYADSSLVVDVVIQHGQKCASVNNGKITGSAPREILDDYRQPICQTSCEAPAGLAPHEQSLSQTSTSPASPSTK